MGGCHGRRGCSVTMATATGEEATPAVGTGGGGRDGGRQGSGATMGREDTTPTTGRAGGGCADWTAAGEAMHFGC